MGTFRSTALARPIDFQPSDPSAESEFSVNKLLLKSSLRVPNPDEDQKPALRIPAALTNDAKAFRKVSSNLTILLKGSRRRPGHQRLNYAGQKLA